MQKTTIEFSEQSSQRLATLAKKLSTTKAEVLRSALALYTFVEKEIHTKEPNETAEKLLAILGPAHDDVLKIVVVPGLQNKQVIVAQRASIRPLVETATA